MPNPKVSEAFVRKLVIIGISTVTYDRDLFPKRVYVDSQVEDVSLKILKRGWNMT
jgi:hypothetical protein